jgi:hypothetical protein
MSVLGDKRNLLKYDSTKVMLDYIKKQTVTKDSSTSSNHQNKVDKKESKDSKNKTKPKLVIVKSQISSDPGPSSTAKDKPPVKKQLSLKRKKPVIFDSDDSDLDFGEQSSESVVVKKRYVNHSSNATVTQNQSNGQLEDNGGETKSVGNSIDNAIQLDSDTND